MAKGLGAARMRYSAHFVDAIAWGLAMEDTSRPRTVAQWREVLFGQRRPNQPPASASAKPSGCARSGQAIDFRDGGRSTPQGRSDAARRGARSGDCGDSARAAAWNLTLALDVHGGVGLGCGHRRSQNDAESAAEDRDPDGTPGAAVNSCAGAG